MQFSTVFTFLTVAMTAAAAPAEVLSRTTITPDSCSNKDLTPYCCNSYTGDSLLGDLLGVDVTALLECVIAAVGGECNASVKCCNSNEFDVSFFSLSLYLDTSISRPLSPTPTQIPLHITNLCNFS